MELVFTEIVKVLAGDEVLVGDHFRFSEILNIPGARLLQTRNRYNNGVIKSYELMHRILCKWQQIKGSSATISELRRILKDNNFQLCSDKLAKFDEHTNPAICISTNSRQHWTGSWSSSINSTTQGPPRPFEFGKVAASFVGRKQELEKMHEYFISSEYQTVFLSGLGGIGKTQFATKFALSIKNVHVIKCLLSGENEQSLKQSVARFCNHLDLNSVDPDRKNLNIKEMLINIMAKLEEIENFSRWLVVIDNVDEAYEDFTTAVNTIRSFSSTFLLVNSRIRDICAGQLGLESEYLHLSVFKTKDSVKFVKNVLKFGDNINSDSIKCLCEKLGNFPLALGQAVAYIKRQKELSLVGQIYSVDDYVNELTEQETTGVDRNQEIADSLAATTKVWSITFDKIRDIPGSLGKRAADMLDAIAFINPDGNNYIFLHKLFNRCYNKELHLTEIIKCLKLFVKYSLITAHNNLLTIHRLVQAALRNRMSTIAPTGIGKDVELLQQFLASFKSQEWNGRAEMRNVIRIWEYCSRFQSLDELRAAHVHSLFDHLYNILTMRDEAYDFAMQGSKLLLDLYGADDINYWLMERRVALALQGKEELHTSLEKLEYVYAKLKPLLGVNHDETLLTASLIALGLLYLKRFDKSLKWCQTLSKAMIGNKNVACLQAKRVFAWILYELGYRDESIEMYTQMWEYHKANLGGRHPDTLVARSDVAICLYRDGKYAEARVILSKLLPIIEKVHGVSHFMTTSTKELFVDTLDQLWEFQEALKLANELVIAEENIYGAEYFFDGGAKAKVSELMEKLSSCFIMFKPGVV